MWKFSDRWYFLSVYLCSIVSLLQSCVANVREGGLLSISVPLQLTASCYSLFKLRLVGSNLWGEGLTQGSEERYGIMSGVMVLLTVVHFSILPPGITTFSSSSWNIVHALINFNLSMFPSLFSPLVYSVCTQLQLHVTFFTSSTKLFESLPLSPSAVSWCPQGLPGSSVAEPRQPHTHPTSCQMHRADPVGVASWDRDWNDILQVLHAITLDMLLYDHFSENHTHLSIYK